MHADVLYWNYCMHVFDQLEENGELCGCMCKMGPSSAVGIAPSKHLGPPDSIFYWQINFVPVYWDLSLSKGSWGLSLKINPFIWHALWLKALHNIFSHPKEKNESRGICQISLEKIQLTDQNNHAWSTWRLFCMHPEFWTWKYSCSWSCAQTINDQKYCSSYSIVLLKIRKGWWILLLFNFFQMKIKDIGTYPIPSNCEHYCEKLFKC